MSDYDNEDFDLKLDQWGITQQGDLVTEKRTFNGWIEDWEKATARNKDTMNEHKLLAKYRKLHVYDPDDGQTYYVHDQNMEWNRREWTAVCVPLDPELAKDEDNFVAWCINEEFVDMIVQTTQPRELNVEIIKQSDGIDEMTKTKRGKNGKK